jgi:hypothetical protein
MVEYYNTQRRTYRRDGSIKNSYQRTYFRADERSVARMCGAGVQITGMVVKGILSLAFKHNPYLLPK